MLKRSRAVDNLDVQPFIPGDIHLMDLRDYERESWTVEQWTNYAELSQAVTVREDGRIIAVTGYIPLWKGVIDVFVIPAKAPPRNPLAYIRVIKIWLSNLKRDLRLHRIQTISKADPATDRWMRVLGFSLESTLYSYGPDKLDYRMWTRL